MRAAMIDNGVTFRFGTRCEGLVFEDGEVRGVRVSALAEEDRATALRRRKGEDGGGGAGGRQAAGGARLAEEVLEAEHVVLAVGHSARALYRELFEEGVELRPKGFAVGFRIEHPQALINSIQYGEDYADLVSDERGRRGYGKIPVADYRLTHNIFAAEGRAEDLGSAVDRGCFSFCMCPGGQIVPTSINPEEVCVNGMSFSRRSSKWANSALVVTVDPNDSTVMDAIEEAPDLRAQHGCLAGVEFQRAIERRAATAGGGDLRVPVQRVTDFLARRGLPEGAELPQSSYRLGVTAARCDLIYPEPVRAALAEALGRCGALGGGGGPRGGTPHPSALQNGSRHGCRVLCVTRRCFTEWRRALLPLSRYPGGREGGIEVLTTRDRRLTSRSPMGPSTRTAPHSPQPPPPAPPLFAASSPLSHPPETNPRWRCFRGCIPRARGPDTRAAL